MADYDIGYGKPPLSGLFRVGVSGNPRGRPRRSARPLAERIRAVLNAPIEYRERVVSRRRASVMLYERWRWTLRSRFVGGGFKPP